MHPIVPVGIGSLASVAMVVLETPNPAVVPARLTFLRAAPGLALYLVVYTPLSLLVFSWVSQKFPAFHSWPYDAPYIVAFLSGFAVPLVCRIKNVVLYQRVARYASLLATIINRFNEVTELALAKTIAREERKLSVKILSEDPHRRTLAIDRLFEEHNVEIAKEKVEEIDQKAGSNRPKGAARRRLLGIFKTRPVTTKVKYLIRYLEYSEMERHVEVMLRHLGRFPNWPPDQLCRRQKSVGKESQRKYEQQYTIWYVLGGEDGLEQSAGGHGISA